MNGPRTARIPRLLDRVIAQRRLGGSRDKQASAGESSRRGSGTDSERIAALEQRLQALENMMEGLQDSIHRSVTRTEEKLTELDRKSDPLQIRRALDRDARERGL